MALYQHRLTDNQWAKDAAYVGTAIQDSPHSTARNAPEKILESALRQATVTIHTAKHINHLYGRGLKVLPAASA